MLTFNYKNQKPTKKTKFIYDRRGLIIKHNNKEYRLISKTTMLNKYAAITKRCEHFPDGELSMQEYYLIEEQDNKGFIYREIISSIRENWKED